MQTRKPVQFNWNWLSWLRLCALLVCVCEMWMHCAFFSRFVSFSLSDVFWFPVSTVHTNGIIQSFQSFVFIWSKSLVYSFDSYSMVYSKFRYYVCIVVGVFISFSILFYTDRGNGCGQIHLFFMYSEATDIILVWCLLPLFSITDSRFM